MREVVFRVLAERPGHLEAQAVGAAFRVRVRRAPGVAVSSIRPAGRRLAVMCR
jgi:hypothetical protein